MERNLSFLADYFNDRNKIFSPEESTKYPEKLENTIQKIIRLYYQIEESILTNGATPLEKYNKLKVLKKLNSRYKKIK